MRYNNVELNVLIKGRPITEYPHNGQVFVEGRENSDFEVSIKNNNPFKVEAVVSVDGLSVIDGKEAGINSSGYLLEAGETLSIPGWKLTDAQVAAFKFAGKGESYVAQTTGSARNTGVIGLMAFKEKPQSNQFHTFRMQPYPMNARGFGVGGGYYDAGSTGDAVLTGWSSGGTGLQAMGMASAGMNSMSVLASVDSHQPVMRSMAATSKGVSPGVKSVETDLSVTTQNLGTGFGKAQDFATTTVSFERGDMHAMLVLYYDNARGLRSRGINLDKKAKSAATQTPNAFPGMNCAPPAGWKG